MVSSTSPKTHLHAPLAPSSAPRGRERRVYMTKQPDTRAESTANARPAELVWCRGTRHPTNLLASPLGRARWGAARRAGRALIRTKNQPGPRRRSRNQKTAQTTYRTPPNASIPRNRRVGLEGAGRSPSETTQGPQDAVRGPQRGTAGERPGASREITILFSTTIH